MKLTVLKETAIGERRVALAPESVKKLTASGFAVTIEQGAGEQAFFTDEAFSAAGATVAPDAASALAGAGIVLRLGAPTEAEAAALSRGQVLIGSLMPIRHPRLMRALALHGITAISTDAIPRTTKAQSMDTLSSMANIAGYRGALIAAMALPTYCPMFMTAAGTIFPAKFFVIGAGVAGLQSIATSRRLGAQVFATDVRPEVKEQIESVGAKYVGIELAQSAAAGGGYAAALSAEDTARQRALLAEQCTKSDAVITTALIGGITAPRLISAEMVRSMKPGSVIVDLGAEGGGNCELSRPGETITAHGVAIAAPLNLPSTMPADASRLWSRNMTNLLLAYSKGSGFVLDLKDEILTAATITHEGEVRHTRTKEALAAAST